MFNKKTKRKKGSALVEFVIIIPVIYLAAWSCMFIIFYSMSQNTLHQAANEGARILTQELRGNTGNIPNTDEVKTLLANKVEVSANSFHYVLLFHDASGKATTPQVIIEPSSGDCLKEVQNKERVICAQTEKGTSNGIEQQQIVVVIRAKFQQIGNSIPGLSDKTYSTGKGTSEKEFSGRFNYWKN